jgi:hypothetical protein
MWAAYNGLVDRDHRVVELVHSGDRLCVGLHRDQDIVLRKSNVESAITKRLALVEPVRSHWSEYHLDQSKGKAARVLGR